MILPWRDVPVGEGPPIHTSLTTREATVLHELAAGVRVLEIGSAYGYSAITMAQQATHVVAVDPHAGYGSVADSLSQMRENLAAYAVENKVTIIQASSEAIKLTTGPFGLVFIDGDHRKEAVARDVALAYRLAPGGVVACHDYGEDTCPGVREALDELYPDGPDRVVDTLWIRGAR